MVAAERKAHGVSFHTKQKWKQPCRCLLVFSRDSVRCPKAGPARSGTQHSVAFRSRSLTQAADLQSWPVTGQDQRSSPEPAVSEPETSFQQSSRQNPTGSRITTEKHKQKLNTEKGVQNSSQRKHMQMNFSWVWELWEFALLYLFLWIFQTFFTCYIVVDMGGKPNQLLF